MIIYVHTAGRPHKQTTIKSFSADLMKRTRLVVQDAEKDKYDIAPLKDNLVVLPPHINRLSPTRQWILENAETDKFVMMDDDLTFAHRGPYTKTKLYQANPQDVEQMFSELEYLLDTYAHVGVSAREGNNRVQSNLKENTRMMRLLGYNKPRVLEAGARFDRIDTKQDFDMTLQLLRQGYGNAVLYSYAHNQPGSNVDGGCSIYRDSEMMNRCSHELVELHPGFVKVVEKHTKTSWGGGIRTDVRIAWKKAYESHTQP
jgi:hypothetical protein